jgi:hypothetical protein
VASGSSLRCVLPFPKLPIPRRAEPLGSAVHFEPEIISHVRRTIGRRRHHPVPNARAQASQVHAGDTGDSSPSLTIIWRHGRTVILASFQGEQVNGGPGGYLPG